MPKLTRALCLFCLFLIATSYPQIPYPASAFARQADTVYTVVAYKLSPQQEAGFAMDGKLSCFWAAWNASDGFSMAILDSANLVWGAPSKNAATADLNLL